AAIFLPTPPLVDCTRSYSCLLFARKALNAIFRKSRSHHRIGQRIDDGAGEPSDHFVGRSLGRPEPAATVIIKARYAGLTDRPKLGRCSGKASFVGDGEGLDGPRANMRQSPNASIGRSVCVGPPARSPEGRASNRLCDAAVAPAFARRSRLSLSGRS